MKYKIVAVVVTYNRLTTLKKALDIYDNQVLPFDDVIVVDNRSTDGTSAYLKEWSTLYKGYNKHVISLTENLGGAGGFFRGQQAALELGADWISVADDDAYPSCSYVKDFVDYLEGIDTSSIAAIAGKVTTLGGSIVYHHRTFVDYKYGFIPKERLSSQEDYCQQAFDIDKFSYVGTFLNSIFLKRYGLCIPDYFIYYDDSEHSIRLSRYGKIKCVPSIEIFHEDAATKSKLENTSCTWRDYYATRNNIYTYLKNRFFSGVYLIFYNLLKIIIKKYDLKSRVLLFRAVFDAILGKLGKNARYTP